MEWHRIKNIIIVILLIVNGFLLVLVGTQKSETLRYEQSALDGSIQVLAENGITLDPEAIAEKTGRQAGTTERSLLLEQKLAAALLGESAEGNDLGGGLYTYTTELGQISIRSGGELTSRLTDDSAWLTVDPESHSAELMDALDIEYQRTVYDVLGGNGKIIYRQMLNGVPLFSCQITFIYENGRLTELYGNLLAVAEPSLENGTVLSLPTVLMSFLDDVLESGDVCSAILSVEPGYLMTQSFTSTIRLRPVWYISTNTADYYVDGISGELSRITE